MVVVYYAVVSTTDGEKYMLGYELGNPVTGDVKVFRF